MQQKNFSSTQSKKAVPKPKISHALLAHDPIILELSCRKPDSACLLGRICAPIHCEPEWLINTPMLKFYVSLCDLSKKMYFHVHDGLTVGLPCSLMSLAWSLSNLYQLFPSKFNLKHRNFKTSSLFLLGRHGFDLQSPKSLSVRVCWRCAARNSPRTRVCACGIWTQPLPQSLTISAGRRPTAKTLSSLPQASNNLASRNQATGVHDADYEVHLTGSNTRSAASCVRLVSRTASRSHPKADIW